MKIGDLVMNDFRIYAGLDSSTFLSHYGRSKRDGAKIGSGRYPLGSGKKSIHVREVINSDPKVRRASSTYNLESFGKDADHNILFITGISGSGKSTLARKVGDKDNVLHLDMYTEQGSKEENDRWQDKEFNSWLDKKKVDFRKIPDLLASNYKDRQKAFKIIDQMTDELELFSKEQYKKGKSIIVEGIQVADPVLWPDKKYFKDKPIIVLTTSTLVSTVRGLSRDEVNMFDVVTVLQRFKHQKLFRKNIDQLVDTILKQED